MLFIIISFLQQAQEKMHAINSYIVLEYKSKRG